MLYPCVNLWDPEEVPNYHGSTVEATLLRLLTLPIPPTLRYARRQTLPTSIRDLRSPIRQCVRHPKLPVCYHHRSVTDCQDRVSGQGS
jgi:hypothetical protein